MRPPGSATYAGKAAVCDEIQPEMLKTLNQGVIWLYSRASGGLVFWRSTERLANCVDHPHTQKGRQERMH